MPELIFRHIDDVPWQQVKAQRHGDREVGVHLKFLEWTPECVVIFTRYDPGMLLEVHGHNSDHAIFITAGSVRFGDVECRPGMMIRLEHGATFGPIEAGPEGTELVEFYTGDPLPWSADPAGYEALLAQRGIEELPDPPYEIPRRR